MPSAKTISKTLTGYPEYLDFQMLREVGLEHIRKLSGDIWTDHNTHDPGITILEVLCYALLDLGYRTNHDIVDLLARNPADAETAKQFFSAAEILGNNPLTISDYRRLLLDVPGVRNAWLEIAETAETCLSIDCQATENQLAAAEAGQPVTSGKKVFLNGLYNVWLELESVRPQGQEYYDNSVDRILKEVRALLHRHRNLCEDFLDICVLQDEQIGFCAQFELEADADPEDALIAMFDRIRDWLSPEPVFYTLQEMLAQGKTIEGIFEGRPLTRDSHGFIDLDELDAARPNRHEIHVSDLYRVILDQGSDGATSSIRAIRDLKLFNFIDGQPQTTGEYWCLNLTKGYRPVIAPELCQIVCYKDGIRIAIDLADIATRFISRLTSARKIKLRPYEIDLPIPEGVYRNPGDYYSIQRDFPAVYGIGEGGLPASASLTRQAQALQLKGYLLFFDQLLANYLAQLAQAPRFFALSPANKDIQTVFSGNIDNVPDLENLVRGAVFEEQGEPVTGQTIRLKRGETAFFPELNIDIPNGDDKTAYDFYFLFDTPGERDDAIVRLIAAFENEDYEIDIIEDDCKNSRIRYQTQIHLPGQTRHMSLLSAGTFKDFDKVRTEAEALAFLGLSGDYFRPVDFQDQGKYTFEVVYEPQPYAEILKKLAETPEKAAARRDRFLNHLLARFGEDFSEYALLRYAAGNQSDPVALIRDKENFLADYATLSQNRSKGFDHTQLQELWDTENTSGLERRVGRLMGIEDIQRRTLAPFFVEKTEGGSCVTIRDYRGRTLWQSPGTVEDVNIFVQAVWAAAAAKSIRPIDCDTYGRFGFELTDEDGCTLAIHPDYYADKALRDHKCAYLAASSANPGGHHVAYGKTAPGQVFQLKENDAVLAQSLQVFDTPDEATTAWVYFLMQAPEPANYRITEDPHGKGYGVEILDKNGDTTAAYPGFFEEKPEALAMADHIKTYVVSKRPETKITQTEDSWKWRFFDAKGELWLESRHRFAERSQAAAAMLHAMNLASDSVNLVLFPSDAGKWTFSLRETNPGAGDSASTVTELASTPRHFDSKAEAAQAVSGLAQSAAHDVLFFRKITLQNHAFRFRMTDAGGAVLLQGKYIFPDTDAAKRAFEQMHERLRSADSVVVSHDDGFRIRILDEQGDEIAFHPTPIYEREDAEAVVNAIMHLALGNKHLQAAIETTGKAWRFRLTDAGSEAVLESIILFESRAMAEAALVEAAWVAANPENLQAVISPTSGLPSIVLRDADGRLLATALPEFHAETERDAALAAWRTWLASPAGVGLALTLQAGDWYYSVLYKGETWLQGLLPYGNNEAVALALENALTLATDPANLPCQADQGACRFRFGLLPAGESDLLAVYPDWFSTKDACANAASELAAWLQGHQPPYPLKDVPESWHFELLWETCDERIAQAFVSTGENTDQAAAQAAFADLLKSTLCAVAIDDEHWIIRACKNADAKAPGANCDALPAEHPPVYASEQEAACVLKDLQRYLQSGSWQYIQETPAPIRRFRMQKDNSTLAFYNEHFPDKTERDEILAAAKHENACHQPAFSTLDLGYYRVGKVDKLYYFYLVTHDAGTCAPGMPPAKTILWKSPVGYKSREEAEAAFDAQYLDILSLATNPDNYMPDCSGASVCFYTLLNQDKNPVAVTEMFPPGTDMETEVGLRLCHARTYPVVEVKDGCYGFRIGNPSANTDTWLSSWLYGSPAEAQVAFERFLALLAFPDNYFTTDLPDKPEFGFELREAGLCQADKQQLCNPFFAGANPAEALYDHWYVLQPGDDGIQWPPTPVSIGQLSDKLQELGLFAADCPLPATPPEIILSDPAKLDDWQENNVWTALEECLTTAGSTASFDVFLDERRDCRFGVRLVSGAYRLARYPCVFHNFSEREHERDKLFDTIRCAVLCREGDFKSLVSELKSQSCYPGDWAWLCKRWSVRFEILTSGAGELSCCESSGFIDPVKVIDLMEMARAEDCYVEVMDAGSDKNTAGPKTWGLFDAQRRIVATGVFKSADEAELNAWKEEAIAEAWNFPLVRKGDGFGFQLAAGPECVLLESTLTYATPSAAGRAFCKLLALLREKSNYIASATPDCGPFGIDIADPAEIKAKHPSTYPCRADAENAARALADCMDAEGFHVVEHMLLRPVSPVSPLFRLECVDCADLELSEPWDPEHPEKGCLVCEDPYSFRATVLIPYWGRRFRDLNFRDYFERTLRRESPAHVLLRIAWITPRQMRDFERCWRGWIENNATGKGTSKWEDSLGQLILQLQTLRNTYPPAGSFADNIADENAGAIIVLDQSLLT